MNNEDSSTSAHSLQEDYGRRSGRFIGWTIVGTVVVVASLLLALIWRLTIGSPQDPRAYPGSEGQSLEKLLEVYRLRLPECAQSGVRYAQYVQLTTDSFYAHFTGDGQCIIEFLAANDVSDGSISKEQGLPFIPTFGEKFGWPQGEGMEFDVVDVELRSPGDSSLVYVLIAIDYATSPHGVYLRAEIL
ncbi:hypothetical protein ACN27G_21850 [Plantactinospora sp. WMMB334]|uniref:hypothetical protein n=1 Tax=Plantactinospora sp. WMMB334 TaxID=3404119 RepID=UPI003B92CF19